MFRPSSWEASQAHCAGISLQPTFVEVNDKHGTRMEGALIMVSKKELRRIKEKESPRKHGPHSEWM